MPKIEYVPKNFSADRLQMIEKVNKVVAEYQKQGYSLTLRQVYYQMVARDIIPNNMRSYKNLGNLINDARLAGLIDWLAIEDRTRNLRGNSHWTEPGKVIESAAYSYRRDHWEGQPNYVEVWVEKDALIGIVGQICGKLDVNHFSCRGYVSQSEMWAAARRLHRRQEAGQRVVLLPPTLVHRSRIAAAVSGIYHHHGPTSAHLFYIICKGPGLCSLLFARCHKVFPTPLTAVEILL